MGGWRLNLHPHMCTREPWFLLLLVPLGKQCGEWGLSRSGPASGSKDETREMVVGNKTVQGTHITGCSRVLRGKEREIPEGSDRRDVGVHEEPHPRILNVLILFWPFERAGGYSYSESVSRSARPRSRRR